MTSRERSSNCINFIFGVGSFVLYLAELVPKRKMKKANKFGSKFSSAIVLCSCSISI